MNNLAHRLIENVKHTVGTPIPEAFDPAKNFGSKEVLPKKPLAVKDKDLQMQVYLTARNSFWYYLTEIVRVNRLSSSSYIQVNFEVLYFAMAVQFNLNFCSRNLDEDEREFLLAARSQWMDLRATNQTDFVLHSSQKEKEKVAARRRMMTDARPRWLDGVHPFNQTYDAIGQQDPARADTISKGVSMQSIVINRADKVKNLDRTLRGCVPVWKTAQEYAKKQNGRNLTNLIALYESHKQWKVISRGFVVNARMSIDLLRWPADVITATSENVLFTRN
ncbi:hypothetical protein CZP2022_58 [Vibrio phage C-ZP2022]|nr:hypothetical protein CZP2022_58 [Vibrio phage C-ZP2022]